MPKEQEPDRSPRSLQDILQQIQKTSVQNSEETAASIQLFLETIIDELQKGRAVDIDGFGLFAVQQTPPWQGTHPITKESIETPGKKMPYFRSASAFRRRINDGIDWTEHPKWARHGSS
ncbi:HU family DNA-binding protein [Magnetococcales bacterium HHB-1]